MAVKGLNARGIRAASFSFEISPLLVFQADEQCIQHQYICRHLIVHLLYSIKFEQAIIELLVGLLVGANSSKATTFGTYMEQIIIFRFAMDAKTEIAHCQCISRIQDGRHSDLWYTLLKDA